MTLVLGTFMLFSLLELLIYTRWLWPVRRLLVATTVAGLALFSGLLLAASASLFAVLFVVLLVYRLVNLYRLLENRIAAQHLYRICRRTSWCLISLQLIVAALSLLGRYHVPAAAVMYTGTVLLIGGVLLLLMTSRKSLRRMEMTPVERGFSKRELPTVTVAIPARNETDDLKACLESLVGSTYQKLEIVVLDDCSQDQRTPQIIRQFAHDGVRFIPGSPPPEQWLAKNYAYYQLSQSANGELILFCGVDVRFSPETITDVVESLLVSDSDMLSIMPVNILPENARLALLIQPLRYAWEIAVPHRWVKRPPLLSTCWVIKKETLQAAGGFTAVTRTILPERYFARYCFLRNKYRFRSSPDWLGLACVKSGAEQYETAVRMRYPQLHRRPEYVALLSLLELSFLAWPVMAIAYAFLWSNWPLLLLNAALIGLLVAMYAYLTKLTYRRWLPHRFLLTPMALLYDVALLNTSMLQYEFSTVIWKGRDLRFQEMEVIPSLPKIK